MGIFDVPQTELIERAAKELQKSGQVQPPQWAMFVKTGMSRQRQPSRDDWWFVRAAAVLRRLAASRGPIGVQKLRTIYGGKKNRGHAPERFYRGSGNILRKVFQQLEKLGYAKRVEKGLHKGRMITPQGISFLSKIANAYMKENNIVLPKIPQVELAITELPKEKAAKKPRVRKKVAAVAPVEGAALAESAAPATAAPAEAKPKRVRAPRKKKAETAAPAEAAPAETKPARAEASADQSNRSSTLPAEPSQPAPSQPTNQ